MICMAWSSHVAPVDTGKGTKSHVTRRAVTAQFLAAAGSLMRKTEESLLWVVYRRTLHGKLSGRNAVCSQSEWDVMEHDHPGYHKLVQAGIASEGAAEQLARISPLGDE